MDDIRLPWLCRWWARFGVRMGWISEPICATHNPLPYSPSEEAEFEEGFDPCVAACRVWAAR